MLTLQCLSAVRMTLTVLHMCGPGSSVGTATELWAGRSGDRILVGVGFSALVQTGSGTHSASCTVGTGSFRGVKCGRGVTLTPQPLLVQWSRQSTAISLLPLWTVGMYRASVPVQYSYTSTPPMGRTGCTEPQCLYSTSIPLLPLLAVRPVQSLSVCTVQLYLYSLSACTVQLYLYSHCGLYGLYIASVPVQYSYTSTPTMSRTACT